MSAPNLARVMMEIDAALGDNDADRRRAAIARVVDSYGERCRRAGYSDGYDEGFAYRDSFDS
jgi:hypothetical protein